MKYFRKTARWNGKKYEAYGKTELEALTKLSEKLAAAKRGEDPLGGSMSVDSWFSYWLATYKEPKGLTPKSLQMYQEKYNGYISPAVGRMKLLDVKDAHLQKILNSQAGRSASHVKKLRMVMQEMFRRARQSRLIPYDPSELLELPVTTQHQRRSLTDQERAAFLAVAPQHPAGLWILTLLYTGIRPGESAALTWADVDFKRNEIHIRSAKESGSRDLKGPKTNAGVRDIPIQSALRPLLLEQKGDPFSFVFPKKNGTIMDDDYMYRQWRSFLRHLDIYMGATLYRNKIIQHAIAEDLTLYCLRHTFCTDLQKAGVPINVAKELMGHSDISVTANIYTHRDNNVLHASMRMLDRTAGEESSITLTPSGGISGGKSLKKTSNA